MFYNRTVFCICFGNNQNMTIDIVVTIYIVTINILLYMGQPRVIK